MSENNGSELKTEQGRNGEVFVHREGTKYLEVRVSYDKGGMCYATYRQKPRGYYFSIGPIELERRDGVTTQRFGMFSATGFLLEQTARLNAKRLESWRAQIAGKLPALVAAYESTTDKPTILAAIREVIATTP